MAYLYPRGGGGNIYIYKSRCYKEHGLQSLALRFQSMIYLFTMRCWAVFLASLRPHSRQAGLSCITNVPGTFLPFIQRPLTLHSLRFPLSRSGYSVKLSGDHYFLSCWFFIHTHHQTNCLKCFTFFGLVPSSQLKRKKKNQTTPEGRTFYKISGQGSSLS